MKETRLNGLSLHNQNTIVMNTISPYFTTNGKKSSTNKNQNGLEQLETLKIIHPLRDSQGVTKVKRTARAYLPLRLLAEAANDLPN